jgi:hypothetical protein
MPRARADGPYGAADAWGGVCPFPVPGRLRKPRENGITMVIDKGVGPAATEDYLDLVGGTVDLLKLAFGTTAFYSEPILRRKIEICARHGVACYPGGTFLKVDPPRPARRRHTLKSRPTAANSVTMALPP